MPTADDSFFSGVILAAGASTRMGRPKQLLPLGNLRILERVLDEAVASRLDEVVLILGHRAAEIREQMRFPAPPRVRVVVNADYSLGQSTSLRLGLRSVDARAVAAAILLGDQPLVTRQLIDRVAADFLDNDSPLVRPVYSGADGRRVPGHPVFLARRVWPEVEKLRGDQGARALLSAHPGWLLEVFVKGEPPRDIDTWEDYQRILDALPTAQAAESRRQPGAVPTSRSGSPRK